MPKFTSGVPVVTTAPTVQVDATGADSLSPGAHRFQLIVTDDSGLQSDPVMLDVVVLHPQKPTAVINLVDPNGRQIDVALEQGKGFLLSGARSADIDGKVVQYQWTLL